MPTCRFAPKRPIHSTLRREPFRLFFPIGILTSVVGVSLWPIYYAGGLAVYPGEAHAKMMVEGFVGAFAIGFLGTAFPKMIQAPSLSWVEIGLLVFGAVGAALAHGLQQSILGDSLFLLTWALLMGGLAVRFGFHRQALPPAGFVLAAFGLMAGTIGASMLIRERLEAPDFFEYTFARLLLYEAFPLGPILGIGSFLFPRFFHPTEPPLLRRQTWRVQALVAAVAGALLLGTYYGQAQGAPNVWIGLRFVIASAYLGSQIGFLGRGAGLGSLSTLLRVSLLSVLLGILITGLAPQARTAIKHLLLIGGYGLLILTVATRVVWGHCGQVHRFTSKSGALRTILGFILMAAATRIIADLIPKIRVSHHIYASLGWIIAVGIWSWAALRFIWRVDPEEETTAERNGS